MAVDVARVQAGVPTGGRYAARSRAETDIALNRPATGDEAIDSALQALVNDRNAFWVPGTTHPQGGYDEVRRDDMGATYHLLDGQLHREDGPAVILGDGTEQWFYEGALHREDDEPASVLSTGEREWYRNGVQHRDDDKPAVIHPDGSTIYIVDGLLHRGGGKAAVAYASGHTEWWVSGDLHRPRQYGPAKIRSTGEEEYWENGKRVSLQAP